MTISDGIPLILVQPRCMDYEHEEIPPHSIVYALFSGSLIYLSCLSFPFMCTLSYADVVDKDTDLSYAKPSITIHYLFLVFLKEYL